MSLLQSHPETTQNSPQHSQPSFSPCKICKTSQDQTSTIHKALILFLLISNGIPLYLLANTGDPSETIRNLALASSTPTTSATPLKQAQSQTQIENKPFGKGRVVPQVLPFFKIYKSLTADKKVPVIPPPYGENGEYTAVVDIGLNFGKETIEFASNGWLVYSFEPRKDSIMKVAKKLEENGVAHHMTDSFFNFSFPIPRFFYL